MPFLENLAEGLSEAAGSEGSVKRIEKRKSDRAATAHEELQGRTQMILNDVQGVQQKIAALDPNAPDYQTKSAEYKKQLGDLQQVFTDLYHPVKNPGALSQLGSILNLIRGKHKPPTAVAGPSMTERMAQADYAGAGVGTQAKWKNSGKPYQDPTSKQWLQPQVDAAGTMRNTPMPEVYQPSEKKKGYKYDPATDEVVNLDTTQRYYREQKDIPPEAAEMFRGQAAAAASKKTETISDSTTTTDVVTGATHTTRTTKKIPVSSKIGPLASEVGPPQSSPSKKTPGQQKKDLQGIVNGQKRPQENPALANIDPRIRPLVQEVGEYRADPSKITSMRGAQRMQFMGLVAKAYPDFSMAKYDMRKKVMDSFTSGPDKQ